jgi:hypothetical protein
MKQENQMPVDDRALRDNLIEFLRSSSSAHDDLRRMTIW